MAVRPVFLPSLDGDHLVEEVAVSFRWHAGMAESQKKKNVAELHSAAAEASLDPLLEVSTKSEHELGRRLSAFNQKISLQKLGLTTSIESAYQGSKVFDRGGPYHDIYELDPRSAKRDERLRSSGSIIGFNFDGASYPSFPMTAFYDWLYVKSLAPFADYLTNMYFIAGYTDIEFNPSKSLNCQARSCATCISLARRGLLTDCAESFELFADLISKSTPRTCEFLESCGSTLL